MNIILRDIKQIIHDIGLLIKYCFSRDEISLVLSLLSVNSFIATPGIISNYEVQITNNTSQETMIKLVLDIYLKSNPQHPEGHYSYFAKNIIMPAYKSKLIMITYNWVDKVQFTFDNYSGNPDDFWQGSCDEKETYIVKALLIDSQGTSRDILTINQQLS